MANCALAAMSKMHLQKDSKIELLEKETTSLKMESVGSLLALLSTSEDLP